MLYMKCFCASRLWERKPKIITWTNSNSILRSNWNSINFVLLGYRWRLSFQMRPQYLLKDSSEFCTNVFINSPLQINHLDMIKNSNELCRERAAVVFLFLCP